MLLNVFEPVIVKAPAPAWFNVQLNVEPAPLKVLADPEVREIVPVPVPAVVVNPVGAGLVNEFAPESWQTKVPPLNVRFFVPVPVANLNPVVNVFPSKSTVPLVNVSEPPVSWSALPSAQAPPTPLKVTAEPKPTPFVVIVLPVVVALNVVVPVYVRLKFVA